MISTVAFYEFWFTIRRKSYYLVTLGMPLLVLAYLGMIGLIVAASVPSEISNRSRPIGIVDLSGLLTESGGPLAEAKFGEEFELTQPVKQNNDMPKELKQFDVDESISKLFRKRTVVLFENVEAGRSKLEDGTYQAVILIPADYVETGALETYRRRSDLFGSSIGSGWLTKLIGKQLLTKTDLSEDEVARIRGSAASTEFEINDEGKFEEVNMLSKGLSLGLPLAVAGLLVFALMMNAGVLLASIAEEKENKVMEVIVSSVSADTLLFGKVLGIVCAGLLQITIWMAMVAVIPSLSMVVLNDVVDYDVNIGQLIISGVFMVVGFMFYGCLLAGMGSLGSSYKDCQQLSVAVILCCCVPMMMPTVFITDPNSIVPRVLSMVPLFSPIGMTLRLASGEIPMWEVGLSLLILVISTWFAIKVSAKLFRVGTLMRGKPPGVKQIWKLLTQGG